ncbi:unnamed protein product [Rotaria sp. Silwood1]|nr:unnamed protein product [Rotaria sp. Silwood1]CAF1654019.1 unnamed protein product [Rotaria sp. Silwood1]CAF3585344.1 unnamed protein product [Rotaria sp. Silwood1]CAF3922420.1 unnamed protein product [Rotaria sp. Silwood1]CAF4715255.1 unnamed protein product [Rotaria sp. Silwood1]
MLDVVRNEFLAFEIRINNITLDFEVGAFTTRIFIMNLLNHSERYPYAFNIVTGTTFHFIMRIIIVKIMRLLRYRKIQLH